MESVSNQRIAGERTPLISKSLKGVSNKGALGNSARGVTADVIGDASKIEGLAGGKGLSAMGVSSVVGGIFQTKAAVASFKTAIAKVDVSDVSAVSAEQQRQVATARKGEQIAETVLATTAVTNGVVSISSGAISLISTGFSIAALGTVASTVAAAAATIGSVSGVVSAVSVALTAIPRIVTTVQGYVALDKIKKGNSEGNPSALSAMFITSPKTLKKLAPKAFAAIEKNGGFATSEITAAAIKEIQSTTNKNLFTSIISILAIVGTVLGFVFTAGSGPLIAAIIGLAVSLLSSVVDAKAMIEKLKSATHIGKKDTIIKVLTIVVAALTVAGACFFAPTAVAGLAIALIGALVVSIPIATMVYLKNKERDNLLDVDPATLSAADMKRREEILIAEEESRMMFRSDIGIGERDAVELENAALSAKELARRKEGRALIAAREQRRTVPYKMSPTSKRAKRVARGDTQMLKGYSSPARVNAPQQSPPRSTNTSPAGDRSISPLMMTGGGKYSYHASETSGLGPEILSLIGNGVTACEA